MTTTSLRGHTALVTGGSRGIGAAIVRALAEAGAAVAINYRERADAANALANQITGAGGKAVAIGADVSEAGAVTQMMERANAELVRGAGSRFDPDVVAAWLQCLDALPAMADRWEAPETWQSGC